MSTTTNGLELVDTHAHIHFEDYQADPEVVYRSAQESGVTKMLLVGCDVASSVRAVEFARDRPGLYVAVGVHPHEAEAFANDAAAKRTLEGLLDHAETNKIVAIGEFGLDYYYENSPKEIQQEVLRYHLELATRYKLPACFHIRPRLKTDAFDDFWPFFDDSSVSQPIRGVLHSFTANTQVLQQGLQRGLYVALNGIMTFTKDVEQLAAAKAVPASRLLLETDAPFLTPKPFRGKICKPEHVLLTAEFLADLRGETLEALATATTKNAVELFNLV